MSPPDYVSELIDFTLKALRQQEKLRKEKQQELDHIDQEIETLTRSLDELRHKPGSKSTAKVSNKLPVEKEDDPDEFNFGKLLNPINKYKFNEVEWQPKIMMILGQMEEPITSFRIAQCIGYITKEPKYLEPTKYILNGVRQTIKFLHRSNQITEEKEGNKSYYSLNKDLPMK